MAMTTKKMFDAITRPKFLDEKRQTIVARDISTGRDYDLGDLDIDASGQVYLPFYSSAPLEKPAEPATEEFTGEPATE